MLRLAMQFFQRNPSKVQVMGGILGGLLLICDVIASYVYMHVVFFGMPHFAFDTEKGRSEILYALSNLLLLGFGVAFFYAGLRARRKHI
jgi:hypothetical protein